MSVAGASSQAGQDWCQSSLSEGAVPLFNLEVMWESVFTGLDFTFDQNFTLLLHMMVVRCWVACTLLMQHKKHNHAYNGQ